MTEPPQAILDLVERFSSNGDPDRSLSYNETQARREFIDPFLAAPHKQLVDAKTQRLSMPAATELLQRQIDGLVYELYGLTEEEIGIVEEGA